MIALGCAALVAAACSNSSSTSATSPATTSSSTTGSSTTGSAAGSNKQPITIGYVGDQTGLASSELSTGYDAALARIDAQNAAGGVNGHMLKLVKADTGSSPSGAALAVQNMVGQHVTAMIANSTFFFTGARFAQQAGIPVTGIGLDGPEWFEQPYTNMFTLANTPVGGQIEGKTYTFSWLSQFLKQQGVTSFGVVANTSPTGSNTGQAQVYTAKQAGMSSCYTNTSIAFTALDYTPEALQIKKVGCDGLSVLLLNDAANLAFAQAIKNAGLQAKMKALIFTSGYDNNLLKQPTALAAADGDYFSTVANYTTPNAATAQLLANLKKYDPLFANGGIPGLGDYSGYMSADLIIFGLEHAGANPTSASFISNLRQVTSYDAGGILPSPLHFTNFGTVQMLPQTSCSYFVEAKGSTFVSVNGGKPICGALVQVQ